MVESNINQKSSYCGRLAVTVSIVLGLFIILSDALGILPYAIAETQTLWFLLAPAAAKIIIIIAVYYFTWSVLMYPAARVLKLDTKALVFALAIFIATLYRLYSVHSKITFAPFPLDLRKPIVICGTILTVVIFALATYFLAKVLCPSPRGAVVGAICLAVPFILVETMAAIWLDKYMLEPLLSQPALLRAKMLSLPSLLVNAAFLLGVIGTILIFVRMRSRRVPARLLLGLTVVIFTGSVIVIAGGLKNTRASRRGLQTGHPLRHVILIVVDALRADALSCYGGERIATPNIDQLAEEAIVFEKAYAPAPWTAPAMSSIMTGLSPWVHGATDVRDKLPDKFPTLAEHMRDAGYFTWAITDNIVVPKRNLEQGFAGFVAYPKQRDHSLCGKILARLFPMHFASDLSTTELTDLSIDWLDSNAEQDFFFWLHYMDPHQPYEPPKEFLPDKEPAPTIGGRFGEVTNVRSGILMLSARERDWIRTLYLSEVRYVDENIGRLLNHLKKKNLYDESLIILTSDHGEEFWEHDGYGHAHALYNESLWVPLMIKLPKSSSKGKISQVVSTESLMPTILDLCKIQHNRDYLTSGSLVPLWSEPHKTSEAKPILISGTKYYEKMESVIFDGMKYIRFLASGREELYDLTQDPGEKFNLAHLMVNKVQRARDLIQEHNEIAKQLHEHYLTKKEKIYLDKDTLEQLKSLGYVK